MRYQQLIAYLEITQCHTRGDLITEQDLQPDRLKEQQGKVQFDNIDSLLFFMFIF